MAATLQEVEYGSLSPLDNNVDFEGKEVVAIHRRSQTIVSSYLNRVTKVKYFESNACSKTGVW